MNKLKPKAQHERLLADADHEKITQHLIDGEHDDVTKISVNLARQCDLFVHFQRLWLMRVADLDEKFSTEKYMKNIYVNKRSLHKQLTQTSPS